VIALKPLEPQSQQQVTELSPPDGCFDDAAPTRPSSFVSELRAASLIVDSHTSVGLETFGNTVRVALEYIADLNNSLGDFACERVMETGVDQWPGWNMDGRENEERVSETAVGQWSSWNMDGTKHEERVAQMGVDQWPGWNMDGRGNEERVTETAVGQWSSSNMDSKENEEKVSETADGQSSCSAELPNSTANRGRSRVKDLSNWKCQTRKRLRNSGLAYVSCSGMVQRQKMMKPVCGLKCRQKMP